jgi:hypothetical protein
MQSGRSGFVPRDVALGRDTLVSFNRRKKRRAPTNWCKFGCSNPTFPHSKPRHCDQDGAVVEVGQWRHFECGGILHTDKWLSRQCERCDLYFPKTSKTASAESAREDIFFGTLAQFEAEQKERNTNRCFICDLDEAVTIDGLCSACSVRITSDLSIVESRMEAEAFSRLKPGFDAALRQLKVSVPIQPCFDHLRRDRAFDAFVLTLIFASKNQSAKPVINHEPVDSLASVEASSEAKPVVLEHPAPLLSSVPEKPKRKRTRRAGVSRSASRNGRCALRLFPRHLRREAYAMLGFNPTVTAVIDAALALNVQESPRLRLTFVGPKQAHLTRCPDNFPAEQAWRYVAHVNPDAHVGSDVDLLQFYRDQVEERDLPVAPSCEIDFVPEPEVEEAVERTVGGEGLCWTKLSFNVSKIVMAKKAKASDYLRVTVSELIPVLEESLAKYGSMPMKWAVKYLMDADDDFHVDEVKTYFPKSQAVIDAMIASGVDPKTLSAPEGFIPLAEFVDVLKATPDKKKLVAAPVDDAIANMRGLQSVEAVEGVTTNMVIQALGKVKDLCPWNIPKINRPYADQLAIPYLKDSPETHPHPIHASIRRLTISRLAPYLGVPWTLVSAKKSNFELFGRQKGAKPGVLKNYVVTPEDVARYAGTVQKDVFNIPSFDTPHVIFHESGQFLKPNDVSAIFRKNPKVAVVILVHEVPLVAMFSGVSPVPSLWQHQVADGKIYYMPEGDHDNVYEQPHDFTMLLAKTINDGRDTYFCDVVNSTLNTHVQIITRFPLEGKQKLTVNMWDTVTLPDVHRNAYHADPVPRVLFDAMIDYMKSVPKVNEMELFAKMRQQLRVDRSWLSQEQKDILVSVCATIVGHSKVIRENDDKYYDTLWGKIRYNTTERWAKLTDSMFKRKYVRRWIEKQSYGHQIKLVDKVDVFINGDATKVTMKLPAKSAVLNTWEKMMTRWHEWSIPERAKVLRDLQIDGPGLDCEVLWPRAGHKAHYTAGDYENFCKKYDEIYGTVKPPEKPKRKSPKKVSFVLPPANNFKKPEPEDNYEDWLDNWYTSFFPDTYSEDDSSSSSSDSDPSEGYETLPSTVDSCSETVVPEETAAPPPSLHEEKKPDWEWSEIDPTHCDVCGVPIEPSDGLNTCLDCFACNVCKKPLAPGSKLITCPTCLAGWRSSLNQTIALAEMAVSDHKNSLGPVTGPILFGENLEASTDAPSESKHEEDETVTTESEKDRESSETPGDPEEGNLSDDREAEAIIAEVKESMTVPRALGSEAGEVTPGSYDETIAIFERTKGEFEKGLMRIDWPGTAESFWNTTYPSSDAHRYHVVPAWPLKPGLYPYPKEDCLLLALAKMLQSLGRKRVHNLTLWYVLCSLFPMNEIGAQDNGLSTVMLDVLAVHFGLNITVPQLGENYGVNNTARLVLEYDATKRHFHFPSQRLPLRIDFTPTLERATETKLYWEVVKKLEKTAVRWKKWTPSYERASRYLACIIDGSTGTLRQGQNLEELKAWEKFIKRRSEAHDCSIWLSVILGDPGCGKTKPILDIFDRPYHEDSTVQAIMPTTVLREDAAKKMHVRQKFGPSGKGSNTVTCCTFEYALTRRTGKIVLGDEDKEPVGYWDLLALLHPEMLRLIITADLFQGIWHEPNKDCILNSLDSNVHMLADYAEYYLIGSGRPHPSVGNLTCTPVRFTTPTGGLYFTRTRPSHWNDLRSALRVDEPIARALWGDHCMMTASNAQVMTQDALNDANNMTMNSTQGLTTKLTIIDFTKTMFNVGLSVNWVGMTRSQVILVVWNDVSDNVLQERIRNDSFWALMYRISARTPPGRRAEIRPDERFDFKARMGGVPKSMKKVWCVPPAQFKNFEDVKHFHKDVVGYLDNGEVVLYGGSSEYYGQVNPDDEGHQGDPRIRNHVLGHRVRKPLRDVNVADVEPRGEKLRTKLPRTTKRIFEETINDTILPKAILERFVPGEGYTNQIAEGYVPVRNADVIFENPKQYINVPGATGRQLRRIIASLPKEDSPLYVKEQELAWAKFQDRSDSASFRLMLQERIGRTDAESNAISIAREKQYGIELWESLKTFLQLPERVEFDREHYERCAARSEERRAERTNALKRAGLVRGEPGYVNVSAKHQTKLKSVEEPAKEAKALQTIVTFSDDVLKELYGLDYAQEKFLSLFPPDVHMHIGKTSKDLADIVASEVDCEVYWESDLTQQEKGMTGAYVTLMDLILEYLHVPEYQRKLFYEMQANTQIGDMVFALATLSGQKGTSFKNGIGNMARIANAYDIRPGEKSLWMGDDVLVFRELLRKIVSQNALMYEKAQEKIIVRREYGTFISHVIKKGKVYKDPVLMLMKIIVNASIGKMRDLIHGYLLEWLQMYQNAEENMDLFSELEMDAYNVLSNLMFNARRDLKVDKSFGMDRLSVADQHIVVVYEFLDYAKTRLAEIVNDPTSAVEALPEHYEEES